MSTNILNIAIVEPLFFFTLVFIAYIIFHGFINIDNIIINYNYYNINKKRFVDS